MDNPDAFANCIINDLLAQELPVDIEPQEESEIDFQEEFYSEVGELQEEEGNIEDQIQQYQSERFSNE